MQMQKNIGKHAQCAIARSVVVLVAEDRSVDLRLGRILERLQRLFCLSGEISLERFEILLDPSLDGIHQTGGLTIFAVRVFLFRHFLCSRFLPCSNRSLRLLSSLARSTAAVAVLTHSKTNLDR